MKKEQKYCYCHVCHKAFHPRWLNWHRRLHKLRQTYGFVECPTGVLHEYLYGEKPDEFTFEPIYEPTPWERLRSYVGI